jgi:hypothetical protein
VVSKTPFNSDAVEVQEATTAAAVELDLAGNDPWVPARVCKPFHE